MTYTDDVVQPHDDCQRLGEAGPNPHEHALGQGVWVSQALEALQRCVLQLADYLEVGVQECHQKLPQQEKGKKICSFLRQCAKK